jgi:hypothetical protein
LRVAPQYRGFMTTRRTVLLVGLGLVLLLNPGCSCAGGEGRTSCVGPEQCRPGEVCVDGVCRASALDAGLDGPAVDSAPVPWDAAPLPDGDLGPCGDGPCQDDSRCVDGRCVPWGPGGYDPACLRPFVPGPVRPQLQCVWLGPPADDPYPSYNRVLHTPLVATLGIKADPAAPPRPSVIFISDGAYRENAGQHGGCVGEGPLRIIDGATCRELASTSALGSASLLNSPVTPAVGDLDGDGAPEIVAALAAGGVAAFKWSAPDGKLVQLWASHLAGGAPDLWGSDQCMWGGVTLADLDDDGRPEVILDGAVWAPDGTRLATVPGWSHYRHGVPAIVADVDDDGVPELIAGNGTWKWDTSSHSFALAGDFTHGGSLGHTAIGNFEGDGKPEVIVTGSGRVALQDLTGQVLALISAPPGDIGGGLPTIADYDGDGVPEVGVAFSDHYAVFDIAQRRILWSQPSIDHSSQMTGSSVFDFNADGRAEAIYGDECFVRVYDGTSGAVLFSQARYSSTWKENPIVADVDGDSAAEIVMPMSGDCNPGYCGEWDALFPGLQCDGEGDCPGGTCDAGYCRCTTSDQCGATYGCTTPLAGTPGTGNVCRARHRDCVPGLRIYRDARDRWASSRSIWNQHAYCVTNVNDDGTIPRTSEAQENWKQAGLNNFRQNVQGGGADLPGPDLTVGELFAYCSGESTELAAMVCNRGLVLVDSGIEVIFGDHSGQELCRLRTAEPIASGQCTKVSCVAPVPAQGVFVAEVDPDLIIGECLEFNNLASAEAHCIE